MTKKWDVYGKVVGSKYLGVFEAETEAEAIELALESDAAHVSMCHQCSDHCESPEIDGGTAEPAQ